MMKKMLSNHYPLLYLLSIPLLHTIYNYLNKYHTTATNIATDLDRNIPFIPEFIIPYIGWYFYMFFYLIYFCQKDRKLYYETLMTINIGMVTCYIFYFFFQTTFPRPILQGNDVFTSLVRLIYTNDQPFNCFPSIHVLTTFIIMYAMFKSEINSWGHRYFVYIFGVLIIASTVFVKQHSFLDGIAAMVLVHMIFSTVSQIDFVTLIQKKEHKTVSY